MAVLSSISSKRTALEACSIKNGNLHQLPYYPDVPYVRGDVRLAETHPKELVEGLIVQHFRRKPT